LYSTALVVATPFVNVIAVVVPKFTALGVLFVAVGTVPAGALFAPENVMFLLPV
jgi:hypothetical protein